MTVLWPRLNSVHSHQLATELAALTLEELRDRSAVEHPDAAPNETGGSKVDTGKIQRLRDEALQIARECGLDHTVPASRREGPAFDRAVTRTLYETVGDNANDLWSGDVWSFITLVVLPDLAAWRFPNRTAERMVGGVMLRNTFSRLWWRAHILGCDLLDGDRHLVEDEIVTITERTSMMRHPRFLRRYARIAGKIALDSDHPRTEVMRVLAPVARRRLAFINPAVLSDDEIDEFIERSLWSVDIKKALEDRGVISVEPSEADDALDTATAPDSTDQLDEEVRTYLPVSEATKDQLVEGLVEIVAELGPIIADHAYRVYRERSGTARLTKKAISSLNRACYMALKSERIAQIQDNLSGQRPRTLFAPGTPPVVVRPIYGRQPDEIPFSELSLAAQELQLELDPYGSDWKRTLLQHFGHSNLTSAASAHLALLVSYRAEELGG